MKIGISIDVDDLDRAIEFYTRGLGLSVVARGPDWAHLTHEGQTIFIMQLPPGSDAVENAHSPLNYSRHWTPVHSRLRCRRCRSNCRACARGRRNAGPSDSAPPEARRHGEYGRSVRQWFRFDSRSYERDLSLSLSGRGRASGAGEGPNFLDDFPCVAPPSFFASLRMTRRVREPAASMRRQNPHLPAASPVK